MRDDTPGDTATLMARVSCWRRRFMERDDAGSIGFRGQNPLVAAWLQLRSEPFLWGIRRDRLPGFLASCGLRELDVIDEGPSARRDPGPARARRNPARPRRVRLSLFPHRE